MEDVNRRYTLRKSERLSSKIAIDSLFSNGISLYIYPLKILFVTTAKSSDVLAEILISVPKKYLKSAVDRNKIKRILREAYRKNKHILEQSKVRNKEIPRIAFIYTTSKTLEYSALENCIVQSLNKLVLYLNNPHPDPVS